MSSKYPNTFERARIEVLSKMGYWIVNTKLNTLKKIV